MLGMSVSILLTAIWAWSLTGNFIARFISFIPVACYLFSQAGTVIFIAIEQRGIDGIDEMNNTLMAAGSVGMVISAVCVILGGYITKKIWASTWWNFFLGVASLWLLMTMCAYAVFSLTVIILPSDYIKFPRGLISDQSILALASLLPTIVLPNIIYRIVLYLKKS